MSVTAYIRQLLQRERMVTRFCVATLLLFSGCVGENFIDGSGYVLDADTQQPVDSVRVVSYKKDGKERRYTMEMMTDSTGWFRGTTGLVGCAGDCPDLVIELIKAGYITQEVANPYKDTVYLER